MGRDLKITVVGNTSVGKTSLLISYTTNSFPGEHVPTVFDNYSANAIVDEEPINLGLWDTAGAQEFKELRPLSYPGTDAFIVCYSVLDEESLKAVTDIWIPEINEHCAGVPIILVGTKIDLRTKKEVVEQYQKEGKKLLSAEDGQAVADEIDAVRFIECSALTQENLPEVFTETIRAVINQDKEGADGDKGKGGKPKKSGEKKKKEGEKPKKSKASGAGGIFKKKK